MLEIVKPMERLLKPKITKTIGTPIIEIPSSQTMIFIIKVLVILL